MKIGIIQERKNPPDYRVAFPPKYCLEIKSLTGFDVVVEQSASRAFSDHEYMQVGIEVVKDLSDCDILFGVKEVPIPHLMEHKKYFFFSHTIKKQPYNQKLLKALVEKKIEFIDYECLTDKNNQRVLGFGEYAGIVGAYNAFRAYGIKKESFNLKAANQCKDYQELVSNLKAIDFPNLKITVTGTGRVGFGVKRLLEDIRAKSLSPATFLESENEQLVFTSLGIDDMYHKNEEPFVSSDFYQNSAEYQSKTAQYIIDSDIFISAHYWDNRSPALFSKEDIVKAHNLEVIADITCDIKGSVPTTLRSTTISDPVYYVNPNTFEETAKTETSIAIMAVDNLPCELPRDASEGFAEALIKHVIPELTNWEKSDLLARATMCKNGKLTSKFSYLQNYLEGKE